MALTPQQQQNLQRLLGMQQSGQALGQKQQENLARLQSMQAGALGPQQQANLARLQGMQESGQQLGQNQQNNLARLLGMQQSGMPTLGAPTGGVMPYVPPQAAGPGAGFTNAPPLYGGGQSAMPTLPSPNTLAALFGGSGFANMPAQLGGGMSNMPAQTNTGMWSGPTALQPGAWRPDMSQGGGTTLMTLNNLMGGGMPYVSGSGASAGWQGGVGGQGFRGGATGGGQKRRQQFQGFNQPRMPTL